MIVLSKDSTSKSQIAWFGRFFSLLLILACCTLSASAQTGNTPVTVNVTMTPTSFLYTDGSWVNIHVTCNSACGQVDTWIDSYGWGFGTLDSNGDSNGSNTIYVPSSVLTPGVHTLTVNYEGNSVYAPSSTQVSFTVLAPGTTATVTTASMSSTSFSAAVGAWLYIHVNCNSACGIVDTRIDDVYDWGSAPLNPSGDNDGGYTTYIPINFQTPGNHYLKVYYQGNTTYSASVSQPVYFTILGPNSAGLIYSFNISSFQPNGNVGAYSDSVTGNWPSITHDGLNRLTSMTQEVNKTDQYFCWTYDAFGNRTSQTSSATPCNVASPPPPTVAWTYNPSNQATGMCEVDPSTGNCFANQITTIVSDPNGGGNTIAIGANQYLYDAENRVCAVQYPAIGGGPSAMVGYLYDAEGQRVAKGTITSWSCDATSNGFSETNGYMIGPDGEQLTEVDGQGNWVHTNVFTNGQLLATYDPQNIHFHFTDWLGTRRVQTDYAGNVESTYQTLPFGEMLPQNQSLGATEHLFTGLERDQETGLDHAAFRQYSSLMGRWMSPDPYMGSMDVNYPQTFHRYAYVNNSPLTGVDPSGLDGDNPISVGGTVGGCGGAVLSAGANVAADIGCGLSLLTGLWGGTGFHGSLTPRPNNGQIWDEHGGFHATPYSSVVAMIGDVGGWYPGGCEFGACGSGLMAGGPSLFDNHHIFPREFAEWFEQQGIDIEKYTIPLLRVLHTRRPLGIHTKLGGDWNGVWRKWITEHPNASPQEILNQGKKMLLDFGIIGSDAMSDFLLMVNTCATNPKQPMCQTGYNLPMPVDTITPQTVMAKGM